MLFSFIQILTALQIFEYCQFYNHINAIFAGGIGKSSTTCFQYGWEFDDEIRNQTIGKSENKPMYYI